MSGLIPPNGFVSASTNILMANGTRRLIGEVSKGMKVLSADMEQVPVLSVYTRKYDDNVYIFNVASAKSSKNDVDDLLLLTPSSLVMVAVNRFEAIYVEACNVPTASRIVSEINGERVIRKLVQVRKSRYTGNVFALNLGAEHAYYGNGIAVGDGFIDRNVLV